MPWASAEEFSADLGTAEESFRPFLSCFCAKLRPVATKKYNLALGKLTIAARLNGSRRRSLAAAPGVPCGAQPLGVSHTYPLRVRRLSQV